MQTISRKFPRRAFIFLSLVALSLPLVSCKKSGNEGAAKREDAPIGVVTEVVRETPWQDTLKALGTVKARESVSVTSKVSEVVSAVHFESGQSIARGAPLVTLTGEQQRTALAALAAQLDDAEKNYQRLAALGQQQLIARATVDAQKASRDALRAQAATIRANLSDRVIRAPFAGVAGIREVSPGALVTPGTVITTLDDLSSVYVDFPVPETELADVGPGQAIVGTAASWADRRFDGRVSVVAPRLDAASRAATVRGNFPNADRALKPGMLVEVQVTRGERPAIVVPEIAVLQVGDETYVWKVVNGAVVKAPIVVGGRVPGKVQVKEGIVAGDKIVVEGVGKLKAGAKVREAGKPADGDKAP